MFGWIIDYLSQDEINTVLNIALAIIPILSGIILYLFKKYRRGRDDVETYARQNERYVETIKENKDQIVELKQKLSAAEERADALGADLDEFLDAVPEDAEIRHQLIHLMWTSVTFSDDISRPNIYASGADSFGEKYAILRGFFLKQIYIYARREGYYRHSCDDVRFMFAESIFSKYFFNIQTTSIDIGAIEKFLISDLSVEGCDEDINNILQILTFGRSNDNVKMIDAALATLMYFRWNEPILSHVLGGHNVHEYPELIESEINNRIDQGGKNMASQEKMIELFPNISALNSMAYRAQGARMYLGTNEAIQKIMANPNLFDVLRQQVGSMLETSADIMETVESPSTTIQ